jgi:phage tail sheath gpL-like
MASKVLILVTLPLWLPLVPVVLALAAVWGLLGWALERPAMLAAGSVGVLAALAVADAASGATAYSAITFDCAVLAAGAVAVSGERHTCTRVTSGRRGGSGGGWWR